MLGDQDTSKLFANSAEDSNSNSAKKKTGTELDFKIKFKTEMCRNWELGKCPFDDKCAFAHGVFELREKTHIPSNYKTKKCRQFYQLGYCRYGQRCQFIHMEDSQPTAVPDPPQLVTQKRLPVFLQIEEKGTACY